MIINISAATLGLLLVIGLVWWQTAPSPDANLPVVDAQPEVVINTTTLFVDVVQTPQAQAKGLGGRTELADTYGMVFVFTGYQPRTFWMKDMLIPIDIIWIRDGIIVGFEENVSPEPNKAPSELTVYTSPVGVNMVLEVRAGLANKHKWKVGDRVIFKNFD